MLKRWWLYFQFPFWVYFLQHMQVMVKLVLRTLWGWWGELLMGTRRGEYCGYCRCFVCCKNIGSTLEFVMSTLRQEIRWVLCLLIWNNRPGDLLCRWLGRIKISSPGVMKQLSSSLQYEFCGDIDKSLDVVQLMITGEFYSKKLNYFNNRWGTERACSNKYRWSYACLPMTSVN